MAILCITLHWLKCTVCIGEVTKFLHRVPTATAGWSVKSTEVGTQRCEWGNKRPVLGRKLPLWPLQEPPSDTGPMSGNGEPFGRNWGFQETQEQWRMSHNWGFSPDRRGEDRNEGLCIFQSNLERDPKMYFTLTLLCCNLFVSLYSTYFILFPFNLTKAPSERLWSVSAELRGKGLTKPVGKVSGEVEGCVTSGGRGYSSSQHGDPCRPGKAGSQWGKDLRTGS